MRIADVPCNELLSAVTDLLTETCGADGYISDMKLHIVKPDTLRRLNNAIAAIDLEPPVANEITELEDAA